MTRSNSPRVWRTVVLTSAFAISTLLLALLKPADAGAWDNVIYKRVYDEIGPSVYASGYYTDSTRCDGDASDVDYIFWYSGAGIGYHPEQLRLDSDDEMTRIRLGEFYKDFSEDPNVVQVCMGDTTVGMLGGVNFVLAHLTVVRLGGGDR